jgi:exopolysaccharide biosynthesis WecB/TagA/CpsF family protein
LNWLYGAGLPDRVYGPTLMWRLCERAAQEGLSIFLYGSTQHVIQDLSSNLLVHFPNLRIAGTQPSLFRKTTIQEKQEIVLRIRESRASLVFVGLGCPRQEVWVYEYQDNLSMPLIAVGAAFDFHAGHLPQAPRSLQKLGLEWLFRLFQEPKRLWRRYLFYNPEYLFLLFLQWTGLKKFDPASGMPPVEELRYG